MSTSNVDLILSRLANSSQVGVLALAIFGYFYTVLPVYQKSLLDEDIAKKTIELNRKDELIAARNQELQAKSTELNQLSSAAAKLKGALQQQKIEVVHLRSNLSDQYSQLRVLLVNDFQKIGTQACLLGSAAAANFGQCLSDKVLNDPAMAPWTASDHALMRHVIELQAPVATAAYAAYAREVKSRDDDLAEKQKQIELSCEKFKQSSEYQKELRDCNAKLFDISGERLKIALANYGKPYKITSEQLYTMAMKFAKQEN